MRPFLFMVFLGVTGVVGAQDHEDCPMTAKPRTAEVDHRHHQATGLPSEGTEHHFRLTDDGGTIDLGVMDEGAVETREGIRTHLQSIARSFAEGDFGTPMRIHGQVPPGADVMKARRGQIRYTYSETPAGGRVTLSTRDAEALAAVHAFLRFQVGDHGTGDPIE